MTRGTTVTDPRRERLAERLRRLKSAILATIGATTMGLWLAISGAAAGTDAASPGPPDTRQPDPVTDSARRNTFFSEQQPSLRLDGVAGSGHTAMLRSGGS